MPKTLVCLAVALALGVASPAHAVFDLWEINEIYKSPDGSVQFIELHTTFNNQQFTNAHVINSDQAPNPTVTFTFPGTTGSPTSNQHLLIANAAFDALNCGVQADFTLPDGFLYEPNGTLDFVGADVVAYTSLPTDGILSLGSDGSTTATNSPTNFAGATCALDLSVSSSVPLLPPWGLALLGGLLLLAVAALRVAATRHPAD